MNKLLFCILVLLSLSTFSQQIKIDRISHEFGIIPSWEGLHRTKFTVINETSEQVIYKELFSSCGCAVLSVSKDTLLPNDTAFLYVVMDPSNEDGNFKKSLSIQFISISGEKYALYMNLNGFALTQQQLKSLQSTQKQKEANVKYFYQQPAEIENFNNQSESYKKFIEQARKEVLFNQYVKVLINIYAESSSYPFEKILKNIRKSIIRDLRHENISEDKIIFANPTAELSSDTNYIQLSIIENKKEKNEFEFISIDTVSNTTYRKHKNYPIYAQMFKGGINHLDSTSNSFKTYIEDFISLLNSNEKLNIIIFSSSSKAPNNVGYTPYQMSLLRAKRVKNTLINELLRQNVDTNILNIQVVPIVAGPEFSTRYYFVDYYYNFQYVKIVTSQESDYKPGSFLGEDSFMQYFYSGQNDINTTTKSFTKLVTSINQEINTKGFATLILESSASNVPTAEYRTCEVLSYERIKSFKKTLQTYLYQEGLDFRKVIYVEERALVQGPKFEKEKPESTYTPFQYIKAIVN
jgi:hypothetical protein